jgi:prepilin-type N-terminal cleavage/methylation domain-containing protein
MTTTRRRPTDERGLTLIEMLVALVVFSVVLAGALAFLRAQGRAFSLGSQRVAMLQNGRFAVDLLEKDLRTAGAGAPDIQPSLIYLGASVLAFNANYLTNTPGDVFAVYYNPDAATGSTMAMTKAERTTLPLTSFAYPDTAYLEGGINSNAETITFWFVSDSTTARVDDFVLYRQVNNLTPELVSRNLLQTTGVPFFQYYWLSTVAGTLTLTQVVNATLPWQHTVPVHLALSDTGPVSRIDSVRAVQVNFTVTNGLSGAAERQRAMSRYMRLPNVGLANKQTCGDEPILGAVLTATWNPDTAGVDLAWNAAVDELAGEKDVQRYVIWRRLTSEVAFGDPFLSIPPAGTANYVYTDRDVVPGSAYIYGLAAQDCTPLTSSRVESLQVVIP